MTSFRANSSDRDRDFSVSPSKHYVERFSSSLQRLVSNGFPKVSKVLRRETFGLLAILAVAIALTAFAPQVQSNYGDLSGGLTLSASPGASSTLALFSGNLFTGGTGTTTFPMLLFQPTGTAAVTTWNTSGTMLGVNAVSGFGGNFLDFHTAGGATLFRVGSTGGITTAGPVNTTTGYQLNGKNSDFVNCPTVSSGFGTSPTITCTNGTPAFSINVGTGGTATSGVFTMPAATTGWVIHCDDITTPATNVTKQTASGTTSATVTNYSWSSTAAAWAASDVLYCQARAF